MPNRNEVNRIINKESRTIQGTQTFAAAPKTSAGIGSVPSGVASYVTAAEYGDGSYHKTVLTLTALPISTLDNGTAGHGGGSQIYDFPKGLVAIHGSSMSFSSITVDGTGLPDDSEIDLAVGTTVATSAMVSLTGTTADICSKDDITLSSSVSATHQFQGTVSGGHNIDGSSTAKDAYLNVAATAATADANGTITLTGTITIVWSNIGVQTS